MKELTNTQILYIENDLKSKGLIQHGLKNEILDHICCLVEQKVSKKIRFSKALKESLTAFEDDNFKDLKKAINKRPFKLRIMNSRIVTTGIAACIFMFVFVVDAQDRPEINPVGDEYRVSSKFGKRYPPILKKEKFHSGIDIVTPVGTHVKATADGVVEKIEEGKAYGKYIVVKHDDDYSTLYATLGEYKVSIGQSVSKGEIIALSGNTGFSTAPHLHYEVIKQGEQVDPADYFESH